MKQPEFAEATGLKLDTLRSVECGRLKLSVETALRIAAATNAQVDWLASKDLKAPIQGRFGPYTAKQFALAQSARQHSDAMQMPYPASDDYPETIMEAVARLSAVFANLWDREPAAVDAATWKVRKFLAELETEYGMHETVKSLIVNGGVHRAGSVSALHFAKIVREPGRAEARYAAMIEWVNHNQRMLHDPGYAAELEAITDPAQRLELERLQALLKAKNTPKQGCKSSDQPAIQPSIIRAGTDNPATPPLAPAATSNKKRRPSHPRSQNSAP